jgi:hypothetical protein
MFRGFATFWEATVSLVMCVRPHWKIRLLLTDFQKILYLKIVRNSIEEIQVWLTPDKNNGYSTEYLFKFISLWILLRTSNILDSNCTENETAFYVQ